MQTRFSGVRFTVAPPNIKVRRFIMGYWSQDKKGCSLQLKDTGLVWGDAPADIMGEALERIIQVFKRDLGHMPTKAEIKAGLLFSLDGALQRAVVQ